MPSKDEQDFLLPVPPNPADELPQAAFIFNLDWLPHVLYGLAELRDIEIWESPPNDILIRVDDLISKFVEPIEGIATMYLPEHATLWHDEATVLSGSTIEIYPTSSSAVNHVYNMVAYLASGVVGDRFSQKFLLKAGFYYFGVLGWKSPSYGKLTWKLDGVEIATEQDWYSSSIIANVRDERYCEVEFDGLHEIIGQTVLKNSSSSGQHNGLTKYYFRKA